MMRQRSRGRQVVGPLEKRFWGRSVGYEYRLRTDGIARRRARTRRGKLGLRGRGHRLNGGPE